MSCRKEKNYGSHSTSQHWTQMERHCHPVRPPASRQLFPVRVTPFFFPWHGLRFLSSSFRISDCRINNSHPLRSASCAPLSGRLCRRRSICCASAFSCSQLVGLLAVVEQERALIISAPCIRFRSWEWLHIIQPTMLACFSVSIQFYVTTGAHRSISLWISSLLLPALVAH